LYALEYKTQQLGHVKDCVGLQAVQGFFWENMRFID
jgi:hypothetical protein